LSARPTPPRTCEDGGAASERSILLGDVLLERRAVSAAQLDAALEEQRREQNGLLGEILVRRGDVSHDEVEVALAIQRQAREAPDPTGVERRGLRRRLEAGLERYVERTASDLDDRAGDVARRRAVLAAEEEALAAREREVARRRAQLDGLGIAAGGSAIVDELFRHLDEWTKRVNRLQEELRSAQATIASRDARIAEISALRLVGNGPLPVPEAETPSRHLLFLRTGSGYELRNADGPPPEAGDELEPAPGERCVVVKVGASPLPGDTRPCAFVEPR
jgi:hypothetical protein